MAMNPVFWATPVRRRSSSRFLQGDLLDEEALHAGFRVFGPRSAATGLCRLTNGSRRPCELYA